MAWYDSLLGSPARNEVLPKFGPEQAGDYNNLLSQTLKQLQQQNFGSNFSPIAQEARTQFQQQTVPSIAERFSSLGARGSSAFPQALSQASSGLEQGLAAQQAQYGLQQQNSLQNLLGTLFSGQESIRKEEQPGLASTLAPLALEALLLYFGGPEAAGAKAGGAALAAGSFISKLFGGKSNSSNASTAGLGSLDVLGTNKPNNYFGVNSFGPGNLFGQNRSTNTFGTNTALNNLVGG